MTKNLVLLLMVLSAITATAQTQHQADSLYNLGRELVNNGKVTEGRPIAQQALEMYKTLHGETSDDYINALNVYAASFGQEENYQKAAEIEQQVLNLCDNLDHQHPRICLFYENMGFYSYMSNDYPNSTKYWELALPFEEKYSNKYGHMIQGMAMMYEAMGNTEGVARMMKLIQENNDYELTKPCEDVKCMLERGTYFASIGDNSTAKEWYLQAVNTAEGDDKIEAQETYGRFLAMTMRDYTTGAEHQLAAAKLRKTLYGENEDYFMSLNTAGLYSFFGKQYQQAIDCFQPVITFYQQFDNAAARSNIAKCEKNIGNSYSALKEYGKAKEHYQHVVAYYETYEKENEDYPKAIERLASAEKFNKDYEDSIEHYKQAMKIYEERNMMEDYGQTASELQLCYFAAGIKEEVDTKEDQVIAQRNAKLDEIIKEELGSLQMTHDYFGELIYARSLGTIAGCYHLKEAYAESIDYYQQYMTAIRSALKAEFSLQSEAERMATWNEEKNEMQELKEMLVTLPIGNENLMGDLSALVYDVALLSKGILLNSSIEFEKVLAANGDPQLKAIYEQTKANNDEIQRLRVEAQTEDDLDKIVRLTQENQALQLQLYKGCKELADFTDYIAYTWKDVQNALGDNDIAIEFLAIGDSPFETDNYMAAMVLTKGMTHPIAVPICNLLEVKTMSTFEHLYELDNIVWGNISQLLEGKQRIFFSADGGFNHIGIEYLKYNGKPLSEQFEVYRLSSTKELCMHHQSKPLEYIALFGDINYDDESTHSENTEMDLLALRYVDSHFSPLKSTKKEMEEIEAILKSTSKTVAKLTDTEASQSAFLKLSNSNVNLIHIATHGAYLAAEHQTEEESMQNSILAFAGANNYEDTHDGILTAADIAKMNLRHCDLVVLSACETGLGKLGDDGVFGLQRGFKNAGVHTLMMSTKKVYDQTTADMMVSFYRHLAEGLSMRESLVKAQQEVRGSGYTDAKYWATFILLDAID
ncbi:MAG: CHAT domain-containing protein [Bacteroidales bacterium]|nr:CHAT domain-containing protein [Bacteroidales bacterium]